MNLPFLRRRPTPADLAPVAVPPPPATAPKAVPAPDPVLRVVLTPPPSPASADRTDPSFTAGRYVVSYDRFGPHGKPAPDVLTVVATSAAHLARQIRTDIGPFLGRTDGIKVTVDTAVRGGKITAGSVAGTFTYARGGVR